MSVHVQSDGTFFECRCACSIPSLLNIPCSRRTEEAYVYWVRRFIVFHRKRHPSEMGVREESAFLEWLAVHQRISASTQDQALCALLFLYKNVLKLEIGAIEHVPRARTPTRLPVVLSRDEVVRLLKQLSGDVWLVVALLYGAGLRLLDGLELRVKDVDFDLRQLTIRRGKGQKDRRTMLPTAVVVEPLRAHLQDVKQQHDRDLGHGYGRVVMPFALDRKFPTASSEWPWQFVFPAMVPRLPSARIYSDNCICHSRPGPGWAPMRSSPPSARASGLTHRITEIV